MGIVYLTTQGVHLFFYFYDFKKDFHSPSLVPCIPALEGFFVLGWVWCFVLGLSVLPFQNAKKKKKRFKWSETTFGPIAVRALETLRI